MVRAALLLPLVALGCGAGGGAADPPDGGPPPPVDAAVYPPPVDDLVPAVGSAESLDLATWNVEHFPATADTPRVLADLIVSLGLDLVAIEEVEAIAAFDELVARLPDHEGVLSTHTYSDGTYQKIGVVYRADLLQLTTSRLLFTGESYAFPRPALELSFAVDDGVHPAFDLVAIAIHLKAGTTDDDRARRSEANQLLEAYVGQLVTGSGDDDVVVLGDFNEVLTTDRGLEVMAPWLVPAYDLHTHPLADDGQASFLPSGGLIDHVVTTDALADEVAGGAAVIPRLDAQYGGYQNAISDHLPVVLTMPVFD
jgi:endonuclease/exonuclease/phosphatase family metal-dependent hydrolase